MIPIFNISKLRKSQKTKPIGKQVTDKSGFIPVTFRFWSFKEPINVVVFRNYVQSNPKEYRDLLDEYEMVIDSWFYDMDKGEITMRAKPEDDSVRLQAWSRFDVQPFLRDLYRKVRNASYSNCKGTEPITQNLKVVIRDT